MLTISYLTAIWILLVLSAGAFAKHKKIPFPALKNENNILILALEVIVLAITFYFHNKTISSPYIIIFAIFLLSVGWITSYQRLLLSIFKGQKKRPWLWRINLVIEGSQYPQNIYYSGDWFQIVAISLIWNSTFSLLLSIVIYPLVVFILTTLNTKNYNEQVKDKPEHIKNEVWRTFTITIIRSVSRIFAIALFFIVPIAITNRDWTIFFGTSDNAINLITTLAQVEATVFALVITFLFVLVEFTNSAYSPRLVRSFTNQWSSKLMVISAFTSITTKFWLMANVPYYINFRTVPNENIFIDWALVLTAFSVFSYFIFIRGTINLMQPEAIVKQILTGFDQNWIEVIRRNWAEQNRIERMALSDEDPMVLFERYLATTIERGDIYSLKVALVLLRDKISRTMDKDDGAIIDEYLFNRLGNVIDILADKRSDLGLEIFCDIVNEITTPSVNVLKNSEAGMLGVPPGIHLLRSVARKAMDYQLLESGRRAINYLDKRCDAAIAALPAYSELWLINPENLENQQLDKDKLWKNDRQLESILFGYFSFFEELGIEAIKGKSRELAWSISFVMSFQILHITNAITEEQYQRHLVLECLWRLEELVKTSCEEKFPGTIYFGIISHEVQKINHKSIAMIISTTFAKFIHLMAKAEILDSGHVRDIAVIAVNLAHKYPETTIPILDSLGVAGEVFGKAKSDTRQENLNYVRNEILGRIDQVETAGLDHAERGIKAKISLAAKAARNKTNQKAVSRTKTTVKK